MRRRRPCRTADKGYGCATLRIERRAGFDLGSGLDRLVVERRANTTAYRIQSVSAAPQFSQCRPGRVAGLLGRGSGRVSRACALRLALSRVPMRGWRGRRQRTVRRLSTALCVSKKGPALVISGVNLIYPEVPGVPYPWRSRAWARHIRFLCGPKWGGGRRVWYVWRPAPIPKGYASYTLRRRQALGRSARFRGLATAAPR